MKKSLLFALALASVSTLSSSALANSVGIRFGSILGAQYTLDNALGNNLVLRLAGYVDPFYSTLLVGLQADALVTQPLGDAKNFSLFYGGGANITTALGGSSAFGVGVQATGGISYQLDPNISVFADVSLGYSFGGYGFYRSGALGVNFKL